MDNIERELIRIHNRDTRILVEKGENLLRFRDSLVNLVFKDNEAMIEIVNMLFNAPMRTAGAGGNRYCFVISTNSIRTTSFSSRNDFLYGNNTELYVDYSYFVKKQNYFNIDKLVSAITESNFAKKSKLYNKIMEDGNVFNPYIHRRFLPKQYLENIGNIDEYIDKISFTKALDYCISESKRLSTLSKIDTFTLSERRMFFTFGVIKGMVYEYCKYFEEYVTRLSSNTTGTKGYFYGYGYADFLTVYNDMNEIRESFKYANSYTSLYDICSARQFKRFLPISSTKEFKEAYKASGAYYTMKHLIMFEGYSFENMTTKESLDYLQTMISFNSGVLHEKCIELIKLNK